MDVIQALPEVFERVLTFQGLAFVVIGTVYGFLLGVLPGVSGAMGLVLLIPVTFGWATDDALLILAGTWGGNAFAGSIAAIVLGVPGDAVNAMTVSDGYPMAKQGKGVEAIAAAGTASALGATVGIGVLLALIPVLREIVLLFGPAEFFALGLVGVAVIATVSGSTIERGLLSGVLGLMFGLHGFNVVTGVSRYDLGLLYLADGIPLLPVFIGVFAFGHALHLYLHEGRITSAFEEVRTGIRSIARGAGAVLRNLGVFLRSCATGLLIGAIPGPGATLATFLAYGQASKSAKRPRRFGEGDIRGVIAPEAANDVKDGAALMPTVAFGVPGTISTGIILLAFELHGVQVGPPILDEHLPTLLVLLFGLFVANWLSSALGIGLSRQLVRVTTLPVSIIAPVVIVFSVVGGLANRGRLADVLVVLLLGLVGYLFRRQGIPVVPLVIALLLTPLMETSFNQAYQIGGGTFELFYTRPIAGTLLLIVAALLLWPFLRAVAPAVRRRRARHQERVDP